MDKNTKTELINFTKRSYEQMILELGYGKSKAKLFADGYIDCIKKLKSEEDMIEAMVNNINTEFLSIGFKNAGIDEIEARSKMRL